MMESYLLQIAAIALMAGGWAAANAWVRRAHEEDRRRADAARKIPPLAPDAPAANRWRSGIAGYEDPRLIGRR